MESTVNLEACLPEELRGPATTITPIAMGFSGAGVYRVECAEQVFVLKVGDAREAPTDWQHKRQMQQLAADAGLAPRVVHVDEARREWQKRTGVSRCKVVRSRAERGRARLRTRGGPTCARSESSRARSPVGAESQRRHATRWFRPTTAKWLFGLALVKEGVAV
jgi:hypothetical protein